MYKALAYKEWLKIRWFFLASAIIGIIVIIGIFLNLRVLIEFNNANGVWSYIISRPYLYYDSFRFIPIIISLIISIAQFFPEIQNQKLKLNLHLPERENKMLLFITCYSLLIIVALDLFFIILLCLISSIYFPFEIIESMLITMLPWFLCGVSTYILVTAIMIEPLWSRRIVLFIAAYIFLDLFLISKGFSTYSQALFLFLILSSIIILFVLISGNRFKVGAR